MKLKSYAKINLFLEVLAKNSDNYHILNSLICFLDIFDEIEVNKSDSLALKINGEYSNFLQNDDSENIILKTTKLMAKKYDFQPNLEIILTKNLPIGAGIGGGSSNCATIILALNNIFNLDLSKSELMKIGIQMGADVPIFLNKKIALVEGIGEELTELNLKTSPLFVLLINPNIHLSTGKIFNNLQIKQKQKLDKIDQKLDILTNIKNRRNDLEEVAIKFAPEISDILQELKNKNNCLLSRMSGAGSTCFGIFDNETDLESAYQYFNEKFSKFYIKKSPLKYEI